VTTYRWQDLLAMGFGCFALGACFTFLVIMLVAAVSVQWDKAVKREVDKRLAKPNPDEEDEEL
jgi:heme exporter protein D